MPTGIISHPPKYKRHKPVIAASPVVTAIPTFMAFIVIHPCAQARSGPKRSSRSLPFKKSNKSLIRFESICIRKANRRQSVAGRIWKCPYMYANAHPAMTGMVAAVSVLGRAASTHALKEFV